MAGAHRLQDNEMQRMMQLEHLERQRHWIQQQPPEKCPRCSSMDTKFCYFNNYSADQPRYFCKACQRHWTKGGRLRNIPPRLVRPVAPATIPGPGGPLVAVNQLHGYSVPNPPGPNQLGLMMTRSARAFALPLPVLPVFCFHQFSPVYRWVDGFWQGPF